VTGAGAAGEGDLLAYSAHDYELMVTVAAGTHEVRVEHAAGDYEKANRDMARLAADVIDQLGPDAVNQALRDLRATARLDGPDVVEDVLRKPRRGVAMLVCRCGAVLNAADMRFGGGHHRRVRGSAARIPTVMCPKCAERQTPVVDDTDDRVDLDLDR
jgi:hypothetical protein